jgi:hypothetical protein
MGMGMGMGKHCTPNLTCDMCTCWCILCVGWAGRKRGPRPVFASFGDAVLDARSRVVLEADADDDDFAGMSANKTSSVRAHPLQCFVLRLRHSCDTCFSFWSDQVAMAGSGGGAGAGGEASAGDDAKNAGVRCRVLLRFVWEVYRAGIYEDADAIPVRALDCLTLCCIRGLAIRWLFVQCVLP